MIKAILFDLDGTFADTSPDLSYALNCMRSARSMPPIDESQTRAFTSSGARGLIAAGLGISSEHPEYPLLRDEFLDLYEKNLCRYSRLFDGISTLIDNLESTHFVWGIVTNKASRFALPLMKYLGYDHRAACIVCGDTTPFTKPHPEPLLAAARSIGIPPNQCVYLGDDKRDIQAGKAALMTTIAVSYGYLNDSDPAQWQADHIIDHPEELVHWLKNQ